MMRSPAHWRTSVASAQRRNDADRLARSASRPRVTRRRESKPVSSCVAPIITVPSPVWRRPLERQRQKRRQPLGDEDLPALRTERDVESDLRGQRLRAEARGDDDARRAEPARRRNRP